jgi:hypothetical protein
VLGVIFSRFWWLSSAFVLVLEVASLISAATAKCTYKIDHFLFLK